MKSDIDESVAEHLLKWALQIARRYGFRCGVFDHEDLASIAVMAVLPMLKSWNADKGTLKAYVRSRMKGAMQDYVRDAFLKARRKVHGVGGYQDCHTLRFGAMVYGDDNKSVESAILCDNEDGSEDCEILDCLRMWRRRHHISKRTWTILICRWGEGMSQKEIALILGLSPSRISQIETEMRKQFSLPKPEKARSLGIGHKAHDNKCES